MKRENTKQIKVGSVAVGGGAPVSVQSMCNTKTWDVEATVSQILAFEEAGCDIVRVAIPDMRAAEAVSAIKERIHIPLVGDIHFDYRLALEAAARGIDKIRINPGNIGGEENVKAVAEACRKRHIPIRIGVNAGSLEKRLLEKYGHPCPEALVESAQGHIALLNKYDFDDICLSLKSSSVPLTIASYRAAAEAFPYPLHLGVTETATLFNGTIQSAVGIGTLLFRTGGVKFVSCPTCGRTEIDLISLAQRVEQAVGHIDRDITVAVMGCVVNGPGEAREADYGIAGGKDKGILFRKGQLLGTYAYDELFDALLALIEEDAGA